MKKELAPLQGTDGIRGRVQTVENLGDLNPLTYYLEKGFLTPQFYELYTYAYAQLMLEAGTIQKGDSVVIGWDPRDQTGQFNQGAINGLRKSGLQVIEVGTLPTPAIPLYMLKEKAAGAVVLTASHNPADQNGIKLFHGFSGMKFLPADDLRLTASIDRYQNENLSDKPLEGELKDQAQAARQFFIDFSSAPENSGLAGVDLSQTTLVVDSSKGAMAAVVKEVMEVFNFKKVIYTNMTGDINHNCGVADIEGKEIIEAHEVLEKTAKFYPYETLQTLFREGQNPSIQEGKEQLTAVVFDGDGDRCFRLDYEAENNRLLVSSGDFLGVHQAIKLKESGQKEFVQWFVNTVESDLNAAVFAESIGYQAVLTGVGDKWILLKAVMDQILTETDPQTAMGKELIQWVEENKNDTALSGIELSQQWKAVCQAQAVQTEQNAYAFAVGFEESGHCITPGFIKTATHSQRCFAGNGLKTALNGLASLTWNPADTAAFYQKVENPFEQGVKETFYTYYVEKSRLLPGDPKRTEIETQLQTILKAHLPQGLTYREVQFPEEASMVFFQIMKEKQLMGAVFIRNSGTEDKSALYLRGTTAIKAELEKIGAAMHLSLLKLLKKNDNPFALCEEKLLQMLQMGISLDLEEIKTEFNTLPIERILNEVELKEKLICRTPNGWALTPKGAAYLK